MLLKAGFLYFFITFFVAFILGVVRVTLVIPVIGELSAVLIEVPLMIFISWKVSAWAMSRYFPNRSLKEYLVLGFIAFSFLMASEYFLAVVILGQTSADYFLSFQTAHGFIGLLGQIAFAVLPAIQRMLTPPQAKQKMNIAHNAEFGAPYVVKIIEMDIPTVQKYEILVRTRASTVTAADSRLRSQNVPRGFGLIMGLLFGFKRPKYKALGTCAAGEVVAVGAGVKHFKVGDRVLGNLGMKLGGHAQYVCLPENGPVTRIPDAISDEEAAAIVFGGTTALAFLRDKLKLQKGDRLLVIGAGGSVGAATVQIGKILGAHVTGVCSTQKVPLVSELGADAVIDYTKTDWRKGKETFDVILDTVGGTELDNARHMLSPEGRIGLVVADLPMNLKCVWVSAISQQKMVAGAFAETRSDLEQLLTWMAEGKLKAAIGNRFPFEQIVQAHELVDRGHKFGNTVILFSPVLRAQ